MLDWLSSGEQGGLAKLGQNIQLATIQPCGSSLEFVRVVTLGWYLHTVHIDVAGLVEDMRPGHRGICLEDFCFAPATAVNAGMMSSLSSLHPMQYF
jgi:hypothetical protein